MEFWSYLSPNILERSVLESKENILIAFSDFKWDVREFVNILFSYLESDIRKPKQNLR
jgi:hypothetical protein